MTNITSIKILPQPIDNRRDEFRRYLERTGLIDALNKVLVNLFHENEKPENTVDYLCNNIGDVRADKDTIEALKAELAKARKEIELLKKNLPSSDILPSAEDIDSTNKTEEATENIVVETTAADSSSSTNTEVSEESVIENPKEEIAETVAESEPAVTDDEKTVVNNIDTTNEETLPPAATETVVEDENAEKVKTDESVKDPPKPE